MHLYATNVFLIIRVTFDNILFFSRIQYVWYVYILSGKRRKSKQYCKQNCTCNTVDPRDSIIGILLINIIIYREKNINRTVHIVYVQLPYIIRGTTIQLPVRAGGGGGWRIFEINIFTLHFRGINTCLKNML